MFVSNIKLKNWRNFQSVDVPLGERVFLAGPNASGKSNFLDAFRFLRDIAIPGGGLQKAVKERGGVSKIRCLAARQFSDVEIEVHLSTGKTADAIWRYAIGIKQGVRGRIQGKPFLSYEKVWHFNNQILNRPDDNNEDKRDEERLTQTFLQQINSNVEFRDIARFFESILYLHIVPQLVRHAKEFSGPGIPGDPYGRNFLERISRIDRKTKDARLKKINMALKSAVPQFQELSHIIDIKEGGIPHLEAIYKHWRPRGAKQREEQFSDGTLRLIGLLWSLLESDSLLLLEEPELSLHPAIVTRLPSLLYRLQKQKKRQVVFSTHSIELLSDKGIGEEEVLLFIPEKEGTKVKTASSIHDIILLLEGGMNIGEAIMPYIKPENIEQLDLFR